MCLCTSPAQFKKALKHIKIPKEDHPPFLNSSHANATTHFFQSENKHLAIVCLAAPSSTQSTPQIYALLVHEAMHIWREHLTDIGETHPSQEFEAYGVQNIAQSLFEAFECQR